MGKVADRIEDLKRIKEIRDRGELLCIPYYKSFPKLSKFIPGIVKGIVYKITAGCVDADTEFMTETGWKRIADYKKGDKVLQYNKDNTTNFVEPINYINKPCNEMWSIKTKYGISQTLSDEHRVISYSGVTHEIGEHSLKEVREIHSKQKTGFRRKIKTSFKFDGKNLNIKEYHLRLQVAVHADGHLHGKKAVFRLKKKSKKERLRYLLLMSNTPFKEVECNSVKGFTRFSFYPSLMTKVYDKSWYSASYVQLRVIASESLKWDGNNNNSFYTTIKSDADFIQYCFSATGRRASIGVYSQKGKSTEYRVIVSYQDMISFRKTTNSKPQFKRVVPKDGRKYCFTVPSGMLVLRNNNNIFITGNSGVGKTQLTKALFVIAPLNYLKDNPNTKIKIKIFYFALEESEEEFIDTLICNQLAFKFGLRIDPMMLKGYREEYADNNVIAKIEQCKEDVEFFMEHIEVIDSVSNPTGMYKYCRTYSEKVGKHYWKDATFTKTGADGNKEISHEKIYDRYEPDDPNLHVIVIGDHFSLITPEFDPKADKVLSKHESMAKWSTHYCRGQLTKHWGWTCIGVQQQEQGSEKQHYTNSGASVITKTEPTLDGLANNKEIQRDDYVVISLYSPDRFGFDDYHEYDIGRMRDTFRAIKILKNRLGVPNKYVSLLFDGATNRFEELPYSEEKVKLEIAYAESDKLLNRKK